MKLKKKKKFFFSFCVSFLQVINSKVLFLLLLLHINDSRSSIRFSSPVHFADDAVLLPFQDTVTVINKTQKNLRELSFQR